MAYIKPKRSKFIYEVARFNGDIFVGHYEDGTVYYNIVAVRVDGPDVTNPRRVIARAHSLEKAKSLVVALNNLTD